MTRLPVPRLCNWGEAWEGEKFALGLQGAFLLRMPSPTPSMGLAVMSAGDVIVGGARCRVGPHAGA
jgi:hypothetical protein